MQVGSSKGDLKLGRFEAADLFPLAQDTLVYHAGNVYGANSLRGRKDSNQFHAAGTINLGSGLSLEIGVVESRIAATATTGNSAKGVRPVLSYAAGPLTARVGLESGKYYGSNNDIAGFGATVGYNFGGFTLTGNAATGKTDAASRDNQSAFGVTVAAGGLVVGVISAKTEAAVGEDTVQTVYASYAMPLFGIKGATVTPAVSLSTGKTAAGVESTDTGLRVRFNYAF